MSSTRRFLSQSMDGLFERPPSLGGVASAVLLGPSTQSFNKLQAQSHLSENDVCYMRVECRPGQRKTPTFLAGIYPRQPRPWVAYGQGRPAASSVVLVLAGAAQSCAAGG